MSLSILEKSSGAILASGELGISVISYEGNLYFSPETVDQSKLQTTARTYTCPYKGTCNWVDFVKPDGSIIKDVAWIYSAPKTGHEVIKGRFAFYSGNRGATRQEG